MKKKLMSVVLSAALLLGLMMPNASAVWGDEIASTPGENGCSWMAPVIVIGGVAIISVSSYVAYKLGQRNYFERLKNKEIKLVGNTEAENVLPEGEVRCDIIGSKYTKQLLDVEIPKLKISNDFQIKHLFNLDVIASPLRLVLRRDDANLPPDAKKIEGKLQAICVLIRRWRLVSPDERVVTFKYLVDLITEMDTLFNQSTVIINSVLDKRTQ